MVGCHCANRLAVFTLDGFCAALSGTFRGRFGWLSDRVGIGLKDNLNILVRQSLNVCVIILHSRYFYLNFLKLTRNMMTLSSNAFTNMAEAFPYH